MAFGHSHLAGFDDALKLLESESISPFRSSTIQLWGRYDPFYTISDGREVYNQELMEDILNLVEDQKPGLIASLLLGSEYFTSCVPTTHRRFDLLIPGTHRFVLEAGAELIPNDVIYDMAYQTLRPYFGLMGHVQALTKLPVVYLLPPPPVADTAFIQDNAPEGLRKLTEACYMPSASLIYKSWCVFAAATRQICSELEIDIISPPGEAVDEQGFLRASFAKDCVHANPHYGTLAIAQLARLLDARQLSRG